MKKFLIAATLLIAVTTAALADGKKSNTQLLSQLKSSLKAVDAADWKTTDNYAKTTFTLNGKNVSAFLNPETHSLIGFSMAIDESALPEGTAANVAKKFAGWKMINPIMFLTESGRIDYYVQIVKNGQSQALTVAGNGKVNFYAQIVK